MKNIAIQLSEQIIAINLYKVLKSYSPAVGTILSRTSPVNG